MAGDWEESKGVEWVYSVQDRVKDAVMGGIQQLDQSPWWDEKH